MFGWCRPRGYAVLSAAFILLLIQPGGAVAVAQEISTSAGMDNGKTISLDVQSAEIGTVLRSLASFSGVNIVASPRVAGKVTVKLDNVPWKEALAVILRSHGFDVVEENGIYRVDTSEELRKEEIAAKRADREVEDLEQLELGYLPLNFANAKEVKEAVEHMLSQRGKIDLDERTNTLLISDIAARVKMITDVAVNLDSKTPQVEINAKLVDMDLRATRELGVIWSANNIKDAGTNLVGGLDVAAPLQAPVGNLRIGTVSSYGDLMVNLQALESANLAHLISNPIITTTDNREASILVGQKIPLIVADEAGNALVELTTIGIKMTVTPHINSEDRITLDIHNEVSDLSSQATVQGGVIINTSESDTRVLVSDGQTAIIAGLIRSVESELQTGVPLLKDVPLLGGLFRSESKVQNERELVIFVTPRIVTDDYLARDVLSYDGETVMGKELSDF